MFMCHRSFLHLYHRTKGSLFLRTLTQHHLHSEFATSRIQQRSGNDAELLRLPPAPRRQIMHGRTRQMHQLPTGSQIRRLRIRRSEEGRGFAQVDIQHRGNEERGGGGREDHYSHGGYGE